MPKKNTFPSKPQAAIIKANGLNPLFWTVVKELPSSIIIRNRGTGEFKVIEK